MGDDNALERAAALLSIHLVVSTREDPMLVPEWLRSLPQEPYQSGLILQALEGGLQCELEQGMRSDEQTQLGTWTRIADQLPLWSGDGDIECLWTCSDGGSHPQDFVCMKVRLKPALALLALQNNVTERHFNQDQLDMS